MVSIILFLVIPAIVFLMSNLYIKYIRDYNKFFKNIFLYLPFFLVVICFILENELWVYLMFYYVAFLFTLVEMQPELQKKTMTDMIRLIKKKLGNNK